jgi:2-polyprenyl-3-methyl-5-hydroxy-6-metoxy-1,4-benzoquinol methylase
MSNYWKDYYNAKAEKFPQSPLRQVDRTLDGREMSQAQLDLTIEAVIQALELCHTDRVVDLCCGNGLITRAIAQQVASVVAVDFSEKLIEYLSAARRALKNSISPACPMQTGLPSTTILMRRWLSIASGKLPECRILGHGGPKKK